jgi:hypothetical protein
MNVFAVFILSFITICIYIHSVNKRLGFYALEQTNNCPSSLLEFLASSKENCAPPRIDHKDNRWSFAPEALCLLVSDLNLPQDSSLKDIVCE